MAAPYEAEIHAWRQMIEERLRAEDGWLTLTGLFWLDEGENTVGSDPSSLIILPASAPAHLGVIHFSGGVASLTVNDQLPVTVDGQLVSSSRLRDDHDPLGASKVEIGSVSVNIIKRGDQYGARVRDRENPARQTFTGRVWFPVDPAYRIVARFVRHPEPRTLEIVTMVGIPQPMQNPGWAQFELAGQSVHLEAFASKEDEVWFVFRDATSKTETYPAGRFLYAPLQQSAQAPGTVIVDFNKAYNPPCVFTLYATCPLPPPENIIPVRVEAGEKLPTDH